MFSKKPHAGLTLSLQTEKAEAIFLLNAGRPKTEDLKKSSRGCFNKEENSSGVCNITEYPTLNKRAFTELAAARLAHQKVHLTFS